MMSHTSVTGDVSYIMCHCVAALISLGYVAAGGATNSGKAGDPGRADLSFDLSRNADHFPDFRLLSSGAYRTSCNRELWRGASHRLSGPHFFVGSPRINAPR
jgi:hypothetical protein